MTCVCVDAVGGDNGHEVVLAGIERALNDFGDLEVLVAGPDEIVTPFCAAHDRAKPLVASEIIGMEEHPGEAIRTKRDSSIVRACEAVHAGEADAFFSAGSTGAVLAAATLKIGRIKGISRPALTTPIPGLAGHKTVAMDLGANADVKPEVIVQFAVMGTAYAQVVLGVTDPKVGLLNNGSEDTKGSSLALSYFAALKESDGKGYRFAGNAEGVDLMLGDFDVVVTDGFTGNVSLKTLEGTAKYIVARIKEATAASKRAAVGALLLKPALKEVAADLSGNEAGGAVLIGCKAPVFIGHGNTDESAVYHGIANAKWAHEGGLVAKIQSAIEAA